MGRRRKNPLLGKIIVVSVIAHIVILPIAAHFGAFKQIQKQMAGNQVIVVPPPKDDKPPPAKEAPKKAAEPAKKSNGPAKSSAPVMNQPHVAASSAPATGDTGGPVVNPNGTAKAGVVPTPVGTGGTGTAPTTQPRENPVNTSPKPPVEKAPVIEDKAPVEPVKPHIPVYVSAESEGQPTIDIPDDLRADALDKTAVVMVTVKPDGAAADVSMSSGTGVPELDDLALSAARKWHFKPATKDGEPVEGKARLHIRFSVD